MQNFAILTHTNSECKDLWQPYIDSFSEYFPGQRHYFLSDSKVFDFELIKYNKKDKHSTRVLKALKKIKEDCVLFSLEDMILFDYVDFKKIALFVKFLPSTGYPYVRLIKSGIHGIDAPFNPEFGLYLLKGGDLSLSMAPTLWNRRMFIEILEKMLDLNFSDLENAGSKFNYNGLYCYNGEGKRGSWHYDSVIYPHTCTAICKGLWNVKEYGYELNNIFQKYKIDPSIRGYV